MTKTKSTKRALLLSALALLLCVSMLIGSTYAWFTDSVTSAGNVIKSGTLDVTMEWKDATANGAQQLYVDASAGAIFDYDLWEPGYVEAKNVKIANVGTLALKYQLNVLATGTVSALADVIDVYYAEGEYTLADRTMADLTKIGTLADVLKGFSTNAAGELLAGEDTVVTIALKMQETAGNEYQDLSIGSEFAVQLLATQLTYEEDSFDDQYDDLALVADAAAFKAALANGQNVMLSADIALDANAAIAIADGSDVIVDLNGHDIQAVATEKGANRSAFVVKGELTVVGNGTVSQTYTGENMAWGNLSAPFSVEGGVLTLGKGVNVLNYGGTDMAYAVDVNTTLGESVLNVDGATLYSTYIAVRIFNNHSTQKGIVNYNSGLIQGAKKGYDIWAQLMSAPAANAVVNVADGISYTTEALSGTMYYIADTFTLASTPAAVEAALEAGADVVLAGDVELTADAPIAVAAGKDSTLDLNGYTLSMDNTRTATHNNMFDVTGGTLTITNGTVAMAHTGANMGWNGATSVFNVTAGGVLNLDGVTVKNEGGTDMNFGVHLNNWGEVTLVANNCVFDSTYCGVRVFNSGPDMNNVTITNSTIKGATRAFWVHNYAPADFGGKVYSGASAAYDEATVAARLNFDVFGNGNTFEISGTAKSPIRYGFNSTIYFDADGNAVV